MGGRDQSRVKIKFKKFKKFKSVPKMYQKVITMTAPTLDTFQFGHIVSPTVLFPPLLPSSFYPSFNKALSLARRIGVTPTTQTLKRLENIKCPSDPQPLKKRSPPKEDEVSLDWSGNEDDVDVFMEESVVAGPSGTTQRYVRTKSK